MKDYLPKSKKSERIKCLANQSLFILDSVGIPIEGLTSRKLEMMALCFMALAGVKHSWKEVKSDSSKQFLGSRQIIKWVNENYEEKISSGSYDDIRRVHLKLLTAAGLVERSGNKPNAATNDPSRRYSITETFLELVLHLDTPSWANALADFKSAHSSLVDQLARTRDLAKIPIVLPTGIELRLSEGEHNDLQRRIIEQFLPRFAPGAEVLYIGDTSNKYLYVSEKRLDELNVFKLAHDELPDIIAYLENKNWLFLIEAVHSSGPISEIRLLEMKNLLGQTTSDLVFVTAFLTRAEFKKWASQIAWETEVWIADAPDHLIHFNGDKFLGPYVSPNNS